MNPPLAPPPFGQWLDAIVPEVFETMTTQRVLPSAEATPPSSSAQRVSACVGIAGPELTGAVYLHLSEEFARRSAAAMLGLSVADLSGDGDVNDVVGEICNMVGGGLKSQLCDHGTPCAISSPAIIRGQTFVIDPGRGTLAHRFPFACGGDEFVVELHIKTQ